MASSAQQQNQTGGSFITVKQEHRTGDSIITLNQQHQTGRNPIITVKQEHQTGDSIITLNQQHQTGRNPIITVKQEHQTGDSIITVNQQHQTGDSIITVKKEHETGDILITVKQQQHPAVDSYITVKMVNADDHVDNLRVKCDEPLHRLMKRWKDQTGMEDYHDFDFIFNGRRIKDGNKTANDIGLKDGDCIHTMLHQIGD